MMIVLLAPPMLAGVVSYLSEACGIPAFQAGSAMAFQRAMMGNRARIISRTVRRQVRQAIKPTLTTKSEPIETISVLATGPAGQRLYFGLSTGALSIWDLNRGGEEIRVQLPAAPVAVDASANGSLLAVVTADGQARLVWPWGEQWGPTIRPVVTDQGRIQAARIMPGAGQLIVGTDSGVVALLSTMDGGLIKSIQTGSPAIQRLEISPDGREAFAVGSEGSLHGFQVAARALRAVSSKSLNGTVVSLKALNDGLMMAMSDGRLLRVSGSAEPSTEARLGAGLVSAGFSDSGDFAALTDDWRVISGSLSAYNHDSAELPYAGMHHLAVLKNGEHWLAAGDRGRATMMRLGNGSGGQPLTLLTTRESWSVIDQRGRFDGPNESMQDVSWKVDSELLEIDRFSENYFEPGLLAKYLGTVSRYAIAEPEPVEEGIHPPPEVTIAADSNSGLSEGETINLTVTASITGQPFDNELTELRLFHNGKRVAADAIKDQGLEQSDDGAVKTWRVAAKLVGGGNAFKAQVPGWNEVLGESELLALSAEHREQTATLRVIGFGIDQYAAEALALQFPVADATEFTQVFADNVSFGDGERLRVLKIDHDATLGGIRQQLKQAAASGQNDTLVLFFSGHGRTVGDRWYFLAQESTDLEDERTVVNTALAADELSQLLVETEAQRIVVVIDACQSGAANSAFEEFEQRRALRGVAKRTGVHVLAATRADQLAPEYDSLGHGLFTYTLLFALKRDKKGDYQADRWPNDGKITVSELRKFTEMYVPRLARALDKKLAKEGTRGANLVNKVPVTPTGTSVGRDFDLFLR